MTFPLAPLGFQFEMFLNSNWVNVAAAQDVLQRGPVNITRGGQDEASKPEACSCRFVLDNTSGNYSPRNPEGIYYGSLGLNTPFRLTLRQDFDTVNRTVSNGWGSTTGLAAPWTSDVAVGGSTPVVGDFSVVPGAARHSVPAVSAYRISYLPTTLYREIDVRLDFSLSLASITGGNVEPGGIMLRGLSNTSYHLAKVQILPAGTVQLVLVDNLGATLAGPVTVAGLTYAASTPIAVRAQCEGQTLRLKAWLASGSEPYDWQIASHVSTSFVPGWVGIRSGIATGNTNTKPIVFSYSNITIRQPRVAAEVADLRVRWSDNGADCWSEVLAKGIRRRLSQGESPLLSTLRRGNSTATAVVAYWPGEEDRNATQLASALNNGLPMIVSGSVDFASNTSFAASEALPVLKGAYLDGLIKPYTVPSPNAMQLRFVMLTPTSSEIPNDTYLVDLHNTGTAGLWRIKYGTTGDLRIEVWSNAFTGGPDLLNAGFVDFNILGQKLLVSLELKQNGANIDWSLVTLQVGQTAGLFTSGTLASKTINVATRVFVDPLKVASGLAIGHIAVHSAVTTVFDLSSELNAFTGELAGVRAQRLCAQQGIPFSYVGSLTETPPMGPQLPKTLLDLLDQCVDVDQGLLYDPRGTIGLELRTRASMLNQTAVLDLDYSAEHVVPPFEPADDDLGTINDVRASRVDGSEVRATLDTGRKSTLDPSLGGAGRYDVKQEFNTQDDAQLIDLAYWLLALGTYNASSRYPQIAVALALPAMITAGKYTAALEVNVADKFTVSNPFRKHDPNQIVQLARGYKETIRNYEHELTFNTAPGGPYEVFQTGTASKMKIGNDTTTLTGGPYSTTATSMQVASTGDLWSTTAGDYPVDINLAGEVVRFTAMSGASSPQTATVTRSINGVVKAQTNGTVVKLARPSMVG